MRFTIFWIALPSFLGSLQGTTLARPASSTSPITTTLQASSASQSNTTLHARSTASLTTSNPTAEDTGVQKFGSHYGWAGFFVSDTCEGSPAAGDRPKFDDQACRPVGPAADNLGISWGSWPLGLSSLTLYQDNACKEQVAVISQDKFSGLGPGTCISLKQYRPIGSIQSDG